MKRLHDELEQGRYREKFALPKRSFDLAQNLLDLNRIKEELVQPSVNGGNVADLLKHRGISRAYIEDMHGRYTLSEILKYISALIDKDIQKKEEV